MAHVIVFLGHIYWENGLPVRGSRRPSSWQNPEAANNPDLVVQTGYYQWRLATDDMQLTTYQAATANSYVGALHESLAGGSSADLELTVYKDDVAYVASGASVDDGHLQVRLIENGRYVQRFDHIGISFKDSKGNELDEDGYFEVTAWPDRIAYTLDYSDSDQIDRLAIKVTSADGTTHELDETENQISMAIQPQNHKRLPPLDVNSYVQNAINNSTNESVAVAFDESLQAIRFDLDPDRITYPEDLNRYDSITFTLTNPKNETTNIPLVFNQLRVPVVTGTSMVLVDADQGHPTGIPARVLS